MFHLTQKKNKGTKTGNLSFQAEHWDFNLSVTVEISKLFLRQWFDETQFALFNEQSSCSLHASVSWFILCFVFLTFFIQMLLNIKCILFLWEPEYQSRCVIGDVIYCLHAFVLLLFVVPVMTSFCGNTILKIAPLSNGPLLSQVVQPAAYSWCMTHSLLIIIPLSLHTAQTPPPPFPPLAWVSHGDGFVGGGGRWLL